MQRYQSHKIVHAGRIVAAPPFNLFPPGTEVKIGLAAPGAAVPVAVDPMGGDIAAVSFETVTVTREWLRRHNPLPGGYFVRYEDGYVSYSPAEAFEKGNTELRDGAVASEGLLAKVFGFGEALPPKITREWLREQTCNITFDVRPDGRTTVCELTMANGSTYRGESSCVDPREFNAGLGEDYSYEDALNKAWSAYGFLLRELRFRAGLVEGAERKL